ncbi:glycosyltransferase family 2 protein [Bacillus cereus group sp. N6]|uniref:glycosyltransferase family 2 protein n=1 Tax=Bacillus cereus group sp. N6 TaxID=2794583 RepID=UPI0018F7C0AA|nr:glycosyltransferase family 2 protein [Bacillus cereus group sp. N6]MBJ8113114.1 glycosyltransferase family 2 protein [Bacillus cereus group sp. N6]
MSLPLVSVLIPTYNRPEYFKLALDSVLAQEYQNIEIIITDDSTNNDTYSIVTPLINSFSNIHYYKNNERLGGIKNFQLAFQYSKGEYVSFLMDDDLFHPKKISTMMKFYLKDSAGKIKLITSYRQPIDGNGNFIPDFAPTKKRHVTPTLINGLEAGGSMILDYNWIGEPTTPLFRKKDLHEPFGSFCGHQYYSAVDMASWLTLLSQGDLLYIPDTLSYLRMHENNIGSSINMKFYSAHDWFHMVYFSPIQGFIPQNKHILQNAKKCLRYISLIHSVFFNEYDDTQKQTLQFYSMCLMQKIKELVKSV